MKDYVNYDNVTMTFTFPVALKVNENKYFYLINALYGQTLGIKHKSDMKKYNEVMFYHKLFYIVNNKIKEYTNKPYTISARNGQFETYTKEGNKITTMTFIYGFQDDKTSKRYGLSKHPCVKRDNSYDIFYLDVLFIQ